MADLNIFYQYKFIKNVDLKAQFFKINEEFKEVKGALNHFENSKDILPLQMELLDLICACNNMLEISRKINPNYFMQWIEKMDSYKNGKHKHLLEE